MGNKTTDYKRQFTAENYERLYITVDKGEKTTIKAAADKQGESLNSYVVGAIHERMERDNKKDGEPIEKA